MNKCDLDDEVKKGKSEIHIVKYDQTESACSGKS